MFLTPELIDAVKAAIDRAGSIAEFARKTEIPESTLSRILVKQRNTVTDDTVTKLASALGTDEKGLHLIAWGYNPRTSVREVRAEYRDRYDELAEFLRKRQDKILESMIFAAAKAAGME